jgi:hypothetical protein
MLNYYQKQGVSETFFAYFKTCIRYVLISHMCKGFIYGLFLKINLNRKQWVFRNFFFNTLESNNFKWIEIAIFYLLIKLISMILFPSKKHYHCSRKLLLKFKNYLYLLDLILKLGLFKPLYTFPSLKIDIFKARV